MSCAPHSDRAGSPTAAAEATVGADRTRHTGRSAPWEMMTKREDGTRRKRMQRRPLPTEEGSVTVELCPGAQAAVGAPDADA